MSFFKSNKGNEDKEMKKTIVDLQKEKNIPLKILEKNIPKTKIGPWDTAPGHTFTSDVIQLISVTPHYNGEAKYLNYFDMERGQQQVIVPNKFLFGTTKDALQIKKLKAKYEKFKFLNMFNTLRYPGAISSSPQLFLGDKEVQPAKDLLKKDTEETFANNGIGKISADNLVIQFNHTNTHCMGWHGDHLHDGLKSLHSRTKADFLAKTVVDISEKMITEFPIKAPFVENIYNMKPPKNISEVAFRTAEGPIHLAWNQVNNTANKKPMEKTSIEKMVKALDAVLAVACVSLFANQDEARRREVIGIAGDYNKTDQGFEYRVLSNAWLYHPLIANMVFDLARSIATFGYEGYLKHWKVSKQEMLKCINNHDVKLARKILKRNKDLFRKLIQVRLQGVDYVDFVWKTFINGMEFTIKDPTEIKKNWNVTSTWVTHCDGEGKNVTHSFRYNNQGKLVPIKEKF